MNRQSRIETQRIDSVHVLQEKSKVYDGRLKIFE